VVLIKRLSSIVLFVLISVLCYDYFWESVLIENKKIREVNIVSGNCFKYNSSGDIINIVKYLTLKNYGLDEIGKQRKFKIVRDDDHYLRVEGKPNGLLKGYSNKFINPVAVEFTKDKKRKCLIVLDIYMYKD